MKEHKKSDKIDNWGLVQKYYDELHSLKEVKDKFKISDYCVNRAIKNNLLVVRSNRDHSKEIREKISISMKKAHKEGRHPGWLMVNLNQEKRTYPEQYFLNAINANSLFNNLTILEKVKFEKYVFDFVVVEAKIDIEIDGGHHLHDNYTIEKDKIRDALAKEKGWKVFRISWKELKNKRESVLKELLDFIQENMSKEKCEITKISVKKENNDIKNYRAANFCIGVQKVPLVKKYGKMEDYNNFRRNNYVPALSIRKVDWPDKEELKRLVWEMPTSKLKKIIGVSDVAISKWCKRYGIDKPPRGYWAKINSKLKSNQNNVPMM